jgi:predicted Zn-dependent protease
MIVKRNVAAGRDSNLEIAARPSPALNPSSLPRLRRLLAATLACLMTLTGWQMPAQAQVRLPSLGESASQDLSIGTERRVGEEIMRDIRRDPQYLDDPVLTAYLESVFRPLVAAARRLGNIDADTDHAFAWEPFLVRDPSVNAFALPGGYIGVHLGMIAITATADQLASVLAHELSHVTQRHIARGIAPQRRASMEAIVAMLLGIFVGARTNNVDVANAAIAGSQGLAIQSGINYTRGFEQEADRVGFGVLVAAGYAPASMAEMFEKLQLSMRLSDDSSFPYLRDHPVTTERIAEARNRTLLSDRAPDVPTLEHALMAARSRVLMAAGSQALQRLSGASTAPLRADPAAPPGTEGIALLYSEALAASKLDDHARADRKATQALQLALALPHREPRAERTLGLLLAEVRLAGGKPAAALQALDALPPLVKGDSERPALLLRAQATLDTWRHDPGAGTPALRASTEALQTWVAERPQDPLAWDLLARTSDALGLKLRSMRAAAEARAAVGDLLGAVDRLRAAQAASRTAAGQDFIEASIIDARMRQLMAQRRQLALEARAEGRDQEQPLR